MLCYGLYEVAFFYGFFCILTCRCWFISNSWNAIFLEVIGMTMRWISGVLRPLILIQLLRFATVIICPWWIVKRLGRLNLIYWLETRKCIFTCPVTCVVETIWVKNNSMPACLLQIIFPFYSWILMVLTLVLHACNTMILHAFG
jgi:hypothetical protein